MIETIIETIYKAIKENPYLHAVQIDWKNNQILYIHKGDVYTIKVAIQKN